jgi:sulfonate transport system substrate-binding protein
VISPRRAIGSRRRSAAAAVVAGVAVLGLFLTGCTAAGPSGADDGSSAGVRLRVGIQNSGSSVTLQTLKASKALDGTPYTVDLAEFDGANAAVEALNAGAIDADIALNSSAPVLAQGNASPAWTAESAPFKIIGAAERPDDAGIAIVVRKDSGIDDVADLAGKKVSFAKGTANHYFFATAAQRAGLDPSAVTLATMPLTEARAAYLGGAVDALVTAVSNARPLVNNNDSKILVDSRGQFVNYQLLVATRKALDDPQKTEALGDLITRLQRANDWEAANLGEVARLYQTVAGQSPADAELSAKEGVGRYVPLDDKVIKVQQDQADVFHAQKVAATDVDVRLAFDDRFNAQVGS